MSGAVVIALIVAVVIGWPLGTLAAVIAFFVAMAVQGVLALYTDWYIS